jgi:hypothetical protein
MRVTDFSSRDLTKFNHYNWANLVACQSWLFRVNLFVVVVVILLTSLHVEGGPYAVLIAVLRYSIHNDRVSVVLLVIFDFSILLYFQS